MAVVLTLGGTALAKRTDDCAEQRKRDPNVECVLEMPAEEVVGDKTGNGFDTIVIRKYPVFGSMIRVRATMVDKIIKSSADQ